MRDLPPRDGPYHAPLMFEASAFDKEIVTDGGGAPLAIKEVPGLVPPTSYTDERRRLGDVIVALGFANRETVEQAGRDARDQRRWIGEVLVESGTSAPHSLRTRSPTETGSNTST